MASGGLSRRIVACGLFVARRVRACLQPCALALVVASASVHAERNYSAFPPASATKAAAAGESLSGPVPSSPAIQLSPLADAAIAAMRDENSRPGLRAMKLGAVRHLQDDLGAAVAVRDWSVVPGGHAARVLIAATAAHALRVALEVKHAPAGVRARFASAADPMHAQGIDLPSSGTVWSGVIAGDQAVVELFAPDTVSALDVQVTVSDVAQHFVSPFERDYAGLAKSTSSGACEVDFVCRAEGDAALARVGAAVARISYVSSGYVWACTGTLLNPEDGSFTPYFFTAAHCVPDQATADTVATLWFYQAAACGGGDANRGVQQNGGARLLVGDVALDGALLRLNEAPPAGAAFAGWDTSPVEDGAAIAGIHHPGGDLKKVSEGVARVVASAFTQVLWSSGVTEGGSSGSGLFTPTAAPQPDYLLRGGLIGGLSACTGAPADAFDEYSRLDLMWPELARYLGAPAPHAANYTGLWWNPAEPGWGIDVNQQDGVVFATLFTYDANAQPLWLVASSLRAQADGSFSGDLYQASGPRFDASPWNAASVNVVGTMTLSFAGTSQAHVSYTVNGTSVAKDIVPMLFAASTPAVCTLTSDSRASDSNYQDLWWNPAEPGWGLAIAHQGNTLFAVLFTYDDAGRAMWLVASGVQRQPDGGFSGTLYRTTGPAFDAKGWQPALPSPVGAVTLRFANGESGALDYSVNGRAVHKDITRMVVAASAPACH